MKKGQEQDAIIQAERQVLRALCEDAPAGSLRETARAILRNYRWRDPLDSAFFEILSSLATASPEAVRAQLPALLTRRGFPDVDCEDFFTPHGLSKEEAQDLMRRLQNL